MVRTIPQLYGFIYNRAERATEAGGFRVWARRVSPPAHSRTDASGSSRASSSGTHAFPCGVMSGQSGPLRSFRAGDGDRDRLRRATRFWIYRNIDAYAVATPEIRATLVGRGIDPQRIGIDGIPVDPRFGAQPADRGALREALGLPRAAEVALVMGGGLGLGPVGGDGARARAVAQNR